MIKFKKSINESNNPINLGLIISIRKDNCTSSFGKDIIPCIIFYNINYEECEIWIYTNEGDRDKDFESMVY